ncbi:MAG: hypothetical protein ACYDD1_19335 [Caulobacteraceae bacterium]
MNVIRSDEMSGYELQCEERRVPGKSSFTIYRLISPAGAARGVSLFDAFELTTALSAFDLAVAIHRCRTVKGAR